MGLRGVNVFALGLNSLALGFRVDFLTGTRSTPGEVAGGELSGDSSPSSGFDPDGGWEWEWLL